MAKKIEPSKFDFLDESSKLLDEKERLIYEKDVNDMTDEELKAFTKIYNKLLKIKINNVKKSKKDKDLEVATDIGLFMLMSYKENQQPALFEPILQSDKYIEKDKLKKWIAENTQAQAPTTTEPAVTPQS